MDHFFLMEFALIMASAVFAITYSATTRSPKGPPRKKMKKILKEEDTKLKPLKPVMNGINRSNKTESTETILTHDGEKPDSEKLNSGKSNTEKCPVAAVAKTVCLFAF